MDPKFSGAVNDANLLYVNVWVFSSRQPKHL